MSWAKNHGQIPTLEAGLRLLPGDLEPGLAEDHGERLDPGAGGAARGSRGRSLNLVWVLVDKLEPSIDFSELFRFVFVQEEHVKEMLLKLLFLALFFLGADPHDVVSAEPPPPVQHPAVALVSDVEALDLEVGDLTLLADHAPVLQPGVAPLASLQHALGLRL